jgi:hypothetical protein
MVNRNQPVSSRRKRSLVIAVIALFPAVMLANFLAPGNVPSVDPTVSIERPRIEESSNVRTASTPARLPDDGEVYRTADRLREASALALAATLYVASQQSQRRSAGSVDSIIRALRSLALMPPGIRPDAPAVLLSDLSTLRLRFRPHPLSIEVLSFPRSASDGPALMVRLPGSGSDGDRGSIFFAERLGEISPPAPFTSTADCVRAGWIDQPIHQSDTPQEQQFRAWLTSRRTR